jgi:hypothetical protein
LLRELDSEELSLWLAYDGLDGIPDLNWSAARICATTVAALTGRKSSLWDHMPRQKESRALPAEEGLRVMQAIAIHHNARVAVTSHAPA